MALLRAAHLGCAVTWQGKVDEYRLCVFPLVCVYMSECIWICASLSKSVLLHVTVPVCISRNASLVKARVNSSYGQLRPLLLSRQQIAMRREEMARRGENAGEGLWGWTLWYNLVIQVWGKHNGHQKNVPSLWTTKPTIQEGTPRYEWIWRQSKTVINKTFSTILIVLFLKASVPILHGSLVEYDCICGKKVVQNLFSAQSLMSCLKWHKLSWHQFSLRVDWCGRQCAISSARQDQMNDTERRKGTGSKINYSFLWPAALPATSIHCFVCEMRKQNSF